MTMEYHLAELAVVQDVLNPKRSVPNYPCKGWHILDVGCGMGQTLLAPEFEAAAELHGIDVDEQAIEHGAQHFPKLNLEVAGAEVIPYADHRFDLVYSRVTLLYSNIPVALREIHRVLKPGGHVWITWHSWERERHEIGKAIKTRNLKRMIDRAYVALNSLLFMLMGRTLRRPWAPLTESVQSHGGIFRAMRRAGFHEIDVRRQGRIYLATARKI